MKRIIAIFISMIMTTTVAFANGNIPKELMEYPNNFTSAHNISISIDDNSDIRNLIEEFISKENYMGSIIVAKFFNLLSSMIEYDSTINVQADICPKNEKMKLSVVCDNKLSSVVSSNSNYSIKTSGGLWADIDLTNKAAMKVDVICLTPESDKYYYFNAGKYISQEDASSINTIINVNEFQRSKDEISQLLFNNSTLKETKKGYTFSIDNDNFIALVEAISSYSSDDETGYDEEMSSALHNMQFLGKDGITVDYTIKSGQISQVEVKADISMNLSSIAKAMNEDWPYKASGIINVKLNEKIDLTKIGTTTVKFPTLYDDNSVCLDKMIEEKFKPYDPDDGYNTFVYPYSYTSVESNILPVVNGDYYVPLRGILEDGYEDSVFIDYQNDVITISSEYFNGFKTLEMKIGDDKVYVDGTERYSGKVMMIDDVTYVSTRLFTDVFGWEICDINHDILNNIFLVGFWTFK